MRAHSLLLAAAAALGVTGSAWAQSNPDFRLTNGPSQPIAEL